MWIEKDAVGFTTETGQAFEDHDGAAEIGAVGGVLTVGIAGPVDVFVDERGRVRGRSVG